MIGVILLASFFSAALLSFVGFVLTAFILNEYYEKKEGNP